MAAITPKIPRSLSSNFLHFSDYLLPLYVVSISTLTSFQYQNCSSNSHFKAIAHYLKRLSLSLSYSLSSKEEKISSPEAPLVQPFLSGFTLKFLRSNGNVCPSMTTPRGIEWVHLSKSGLTFHLKHEIRLIQTAQLKIYRKRKNGHYLVPNSATDY